MLRNVGAGLAAAALMIAAPSGHAQSITLLTEENPPFNFARDGKPAGVSTDVVNEMIRRAGMTADVEILPWDRAYRRAQAQKDTCLYSTARIRNREKLFIWVGPIAMNKYVLVARSDFEGTINSDADVRPYKIGAVKTDAKAELLRSRAITNIVESDVEEQIPPRLFLKKGHPERIDLWVSGLYTYRKVAEKAKVSGIKPVYVAGDQPLYLACSPLTRNVVLKRLQAAYQSMRDDGAWARIVAEGEKRYGR